MEHRTDDPRPRDLPLLDIGGEGAHPGAWNLNPSRTKTCGPERGQPIPRHLLGRAEAIPLPDASAAVVMMERTPLRRVALAEIRRVVAPGGQIILRHACPPGIDPHALAVTAWGPPARQRRYLGGEIPWQETVFEIRGAGHSTSEP